MFVVVLVSCFALWYTLRRVNFTRRTNLKSLPYPPGPRPKWIIGNLGEMPTPINFQALLKWKEQYGDLTFLRALGQSVLVVNSLKAATDLLEKRGVAYAHRPQFVVAGELMQLNQGMAMMDYGPKQRLGRRLAHRALSPDAIKRYEPVLQKHALLLLESLLSAPDEFESAIRLATARNILSVSYGLNIETAESEYIVNAEKTMDIVERSTAPGAFLADLLPFLKHVPKWFPFASFKHIAEQGRKQILEFAERPFVFVKQEMERGSARPSLVLDILTERDPLLSKSEEAEKDYLIMRHVGSLYGAATGTSTATLLTFFMLMALNPGKQRAAQDEIDSVTKGHRLPNFTDRVRLPYVAALVKEVMRWHSVVPLGLARQTRAPDVYNGYYIPENTIVLYNLWAMGKTEGTSGALDDFLPERFLDGKETVDPYCYVFGFGRRICPGRHLADSALFILFASILASFTISKKMAAEGSSEAGSEMPIPIAFTRHLISYPEKFVCDIQPRATQTARLVHEAIESMADPQEGVEDTF